jgi:hypothetical protein
MTFAQRRNRLTTHFSERIPVVKRRIYVQASADTSSRGVLPSVCMSLSVIRCNSNSLHLKLISSRGRIKKETLKILQQMGNIQLQTFLTKGRSARCHSGACWMLKTRITQIAYNEWRDRFYLTAFNNVPSRLCHERVFGALLNDDSF